jgi:hypothetical protein
MKLFYRYGLWPVFFTSQILALALLSWHIMAQVHFAYPLGYKLLGLKAHIAEFAPLNNFKRDFELIQPEEHWRLFGEISTAVQASGAGLAKIEYRLANGQHTPLMHSAEIIHLQDVANLIDNIYRLGAGAWLIWLGLIALVYRQKMQLPAAKKIFIGFAASLGVVALGLSLIGTKKCFYWLHEQIFPAGHQWFFFYQDSLMTTLMKAPDIFAFIAALLTSLLVLSGWLSLVVTRRLLTRA